MTKDAPDSPSCACCAPYWGAMAEDGIELYGSIRALAPR